MKDRDSRFDPNGVGSGRIDRNRAGALQLRLQRVRLRTLHEDIEPRLARVGHARDDGRLAVDEAFTLP